MFVGVLVAEANRSEFDQKPLHLLLDRHNHPSRVLLALFGNLLSPATTYTIILWKIEQGCPVTKHGVKIGLATSTTHNGYKKHPNPRNVSCEDSLPIYSSLVVVVGVAM